MDPAARRGGGSSATQASVIISLSCSQTKGASQLSFIALFNVGFVRITIVPAEFDLFLRSRF